ncbi:uncharacterized protein [Haliotis asinina]|uniref:uncharacterized protein n=1 Tax=Haliotis asinina TaxID=109174 RepID=UPI00353234B4
MTWTVAIVTGVAGLIATAVTTPKKGIGISMKNYHCNDTVTMWDVHWWYSWTLQYNNDHTMGCSSRGEFVPMIWGLANFTQLNIPSFATHVLGVNEPNENHPGHMTPKVAASHWPQIESAALGKSLISPAPARCNVNGTNCLMDNLQWLDEFFKECSGCKVDYVAVHTYTCGVENDMRFLETVHKRYKKRIWLTEFACPMTDSITRVENYMKGIVPRLERAPFVARYAWFGSRIPVDKYVHKVNALLEDDKSTLTPLGRLYNTLR